MKVALKERRLNGVAMIPETFWDTLAKFQTVQFLTGFK
jgi:hypothetical protein